MFLTSGVKACTTPVLAWTSPRSRSQPSQSRLDQLRCSTPWLQLTVGAMAHCRTYKTQLTEWSGTLKTKCCEATAWCKDFKDQPSIRHSHTAGTYAKNHLHASETHEKQHLPTHEYLACASERFHRAWASKFWRDQKSAHALSGVASGNHVTQTPQSKGLQAPRLEPTTSFSGNRWWPVQV